MLFVLNSLNKNLFTAKSKDRKSCLVNGQTSVAYNNTGILFVTNNSRITSSEAVRPTFPKIALAAR